MRILAIDPGEKNIGIAISDPTGSLARPLLVLKHKNYSVDAKAIADLAAQHRVGLIIIGQALDDEGQPTLSGRKARRLAGTIRSKTEVPAELWDESHSTQDARKARIKQGVSRSKRAGHLDASAAAIILQSYIEAHAWDQIHGT